MPAPEWQRRLRVAAFKGVYFSGISHATPGGKRTVRHEIPGADYPQIDDAGERAREIDLEAIIVGSTYMDLRDELLAACRSPGPGDLIHPWYGVIRCQCVGIVPRESEREGGIARISLTFHEVSGVTVTPDPDMTAATGADADLAALSLAARIEAGLADFTGWIGEHGLNDLKAAYQFANDVIEGASDIYGSTVGAALQAFHDADTALAGLLGDTAGLASNITETFGNLSTLIPSTQTLAGYEMCMRLFGFGDGSSPYGGDVKTLPQNTAREQVAADNQTLLVDAVKNMALIEAARLAVTTTPTSYNQAADIRDRLVDALDTQINAAGEAGADDLLVSLEALRASATLALRGVGANLARVVDHQLPYVVVPAVVLAYDLYGDPDRDQEIVDRNPTAHHPGFLPTAAPLEVLSA